VDFSLFWANIVLVYVILQWYVLPSVLRNNAVWSMARKRKPGGGRKPKHGTVMRSQLTVRMPDDLRAYLEEAAQRRGYTLTDALMAKLRLSLDTEREQERDPAVTALNFVIAQLAERIAGGTYMADKEARSGFQKEWRTDPFKFSAFKFAVGKLLDALQPPGEIVPPPEWAHKEAAKFFGVSPQIQRLFLETQKTPEGYGALEFGALWTQLNRANPLTEKENVLGRQYPAFGKFIEWESYGFEKARRALGIDKRSIDKSKSQRKGG
jgi:hypothetical protein